jgi:hypothetical protein
MRKHLTAAAAIGLAAILAAGAASASAATEVGSECTANSATGGPSVIVPFTAPAGALPVSVPTAGVITKWTFRMAIEEPALPAVGTTLKVLRPTGPPNTFQVIAESEHERVANGTFSFGARIPVQAGDRVGLSSTVEGSGLIIYCKAPANTMGYTLGDVAAGSTGTWQTAPVEAQAPISATVEPDADGDGYGDETQDQCPQSASTQAACPVIVVDSYPLARKSSIVVLVAVDETAPVSVAGTVKLPKGKKAKLKQVSRTVSAGKLTSFKLKFPGNLKSALKGLAPGKKLTAKLTATATNVAGQKSTDKAKLKLKG